MFRKKSEEQEAEVVTAKPPKMPDPDVRKRNVSVIGPTLRFKGELSANEDLVIEGQIEGTIAHQDKNLTIGKEGRVRADIHAKIVEILGQVEGDVRGDEIVRLHKTAAVIGNIYSPRIVMEDGANFSGMVDMGTKKNSAMETSPSNMTVKKEALKRANLNFAGSTTQANTGGS
ncbi:MAG TPA: polymer-forming cytoskeletal protein [Woeseiaceae bacterium]|nr:polymer-forming cytoskeletal protein [Woeseiaceae bacterium]